MNTTTSKNTTTIKAAKVLQFPLKGESIQVEIRLRGRQAENRAIMIQRGIRSLQQLEHFGDPMATPVRVGLAALDNAYTHISARNLEDGLRCLHRGWLAICTVNTDNTTRRSTKSLEGACAWLKGAFDALLQHYINSVNHPNRAETEINHLGLAENCLIQSSRAAIKYLVRRD